MRKFLLLVCLFCLFAGVVNASSINGEYNGNPIVKVKVNGKEIASEVPAQIIDGSTLLPLRAVSEALGAEVKWDENTYSVEISSNGVDLVKKDFELFKKWAESHNGSQVRLSFDEFGAYINLRYDSTNDKDKDVQNIYGILLVSNLLNANEIYLNYHINNVYMGDYIIDFEKFKKYVRKESSESYITFKPVNEDSQINPILPAPSISTPNVIESKIEGDFEGFDYENLYELDNGQIWKQIDFTIGVYYKYRPDVLIYKDGLNYYMIVEGIDKKVKVERIK